jgi:hypothetical protein
MKEAKHYVERPVKFRIFLLLYPLLVMVLVLVLEK